MFSRGWRWLVLGVLVCLLGCGTRVRDYNENVPPPSTPPAGGGGAPDDGTLDGLPVEADDSATTEAGKAKAAPSGQRKPSRQPENPPVQTREAVFD